ncbi:hypothetical protein AUTU_24060 [Aureibacter tunicatorum]|nr:hypothetical protein AUTU_24060 [Aureibacter tunicatorum]
MLQETPVAIVGMASLFADSANLEQYWENILQGIDCVKEVPGDRWKIEDLYDPDPMKADKTYCKVGGFIPDIDFNPMEFGLPPNLLEVTDASQLLSLLVARDALTDAGYAPGSEALNADVRKNTGCILGVGGGQKLITPLTARLQEPVWRKALEKHNLPEEEIVQIVEKIKAAYIPWTENSFPGMLGNVIAGRVANRFDLGGINSVVDAACAASLSAIKMAVSELIEGRCDMMVTGGVDTDNSPFMYMSFSKTPAFSKQGSIRPFDHEGDGMLIGEGVGMVVLKRLDDAVRDGDRIYSVIKGIGGSSDGKFKSIYAPRPSGQALAMNRAYEEAGFDASSVGLIEAHGTGTNAGDAAEGESMKMVFGANDERKNHIALGSVKSQVGHTKAAAGVAGMIKAAMALHQKVLPGTINVTQPNEKLDINNSPLYVNTETRPWFRKSSQTPRRAGISAFGFGGVNLHFAMEEYTAEQQKAYRVENFHNLILLNAATPADLITEVDAKLEALNSDDASINLKELAIASKTVNIPSHNARLGFVASSTTEAVNKLQVARKMLVEKQAEVEWNHPLMGVYYRSSAVSNSEKVVALFAGQGSQYVNMGRSLANSFPTVRNAFADSNNLFENAGESLLTDTVYPIPVFSDEERKNQQAVLTRTQNAQPAIGALSAGMFKLLKGAGFEADFYAGHSYGELTALWASGVIDETTFHSLSKARGAAMGAPNDGEDSSMLAVKAPATALKTEIAVYSDVKIANVNSDNQTILGGSTASLQRLKDELKAKGYLATLLPVSAAFHTPYVEHAQKPFAQAIANANFKTSSKVVYSNTSGAAYPNQPEKYKQILTDHMLNSVLFKDQVENIYNAGGRVFVEFGPKNILTNLVKDILGEKPYHAIALNANPKKDDYQQFVEAVIQLSVLGIQVQGFDKFALDKVEKKPKAKISVTLNGANYVSDGYRKKYEALLAEEVSASNSAEEPKTLAEEIETVVVETQDVATVFQEKILNKKNKELEEAMAEKELLNQIQADIQRLTDQQGRIEQMLKALFSMQTENQLQAAQQPAAQLGQAEVNNTQPVVETPTLEPVDTVVEVKAPVAAAPVQEPVAPSQGGVSRKEIEDSLMVVIAEKTGYPSEMLEMSMDMEADLGIDSIKRVEIFGAMTDANPSVQGVEPSELAELRTLEQIADYIASKAGATSAPAAQAAPAVETPAPVAAAPVQETSASSQGGVSRKEIEDSLMVVIAEKTGYPSEMLEMSMDMEADLGIDSIKRVEIFGAMTDANPSVQGVEPSELAELRTLEQIADYIASKAGATSAPAAQAAPAVETPAPVAAAPVAAAPVQETVAPAQGGVSRKEIEDSLMVVIAEKTGYPSEMLELSMDMEADLGIDSIKRVEIFGAMTDANPSVQGVEPSELAELRTLEQIADYIASKAGATSSPAAQAAPVVETPAPVAAAPVQEPVAPAQGGVSRKEIEDSLMVVIAEKTGYPSEMLELSMDMEADLGIDSIKRVEIFGAMTDANPSVQGVEPSELAELRTLEQIADYIASKAGAASASAAQAVPAVETPAPVAAAPVQETVAPAEGGVSRKEIEDSLMVVIAEKTGYPSEMLELSMDMEADLGIDSIKRVEIFGAMTDANPSVQGVEPSELAELRTLEQIADYIASKAGAASAQAAPAVETPAPVAAAPVQETVAPAQGGVSRKEIEDSLMVVIAEKTGYPAEMLELSMDMEADLGIDSIKRVEIFGAMTDANPSVQGVEPSELAELRTLEQIADYITAKAGGNTESADAEKKKPTQQSSVETSKTSTQGDSTAFTAGEYPRVPRSDVRVKFIPEPDQLNIPVDAQSTALVTNDGSGLTISVCEELIAKGHQVTILTFPESLVRKNKTALPQGVKEIILTEVSDQNIGEAVAQAGSVSNFIHLQPSFLFPLGKLGFHFDKEKALVKSVYLLAKHLKPTLNENSKKQRTSFISVMRLDGALGVKNPGNISFISGGLFGLNKCLNLEWKNVFCRGIDIAFTMNAELAASKIVNEIYDADNCLTDIAYNAEGKRFTLVAEEMEPVQGQIDSTITSENVFVVTGGARGVTADCVKQMAKTFKSKFILIGRSPLADSEPTWAQGIDDKTALNKSAMQALIAEGKKPLPKDVQRMVGRVLAQREIQENLAYIKSVGAEAYYKSADATDPEALKKAIDEVTSITGKVTGIIHGAGVLADKLIENKTEADFDAVFDVKIKGLLAVTSAVNIHDIKHVVFFSSVAGFYGNVGQTDYAIANEILSKTAHLFKKNHPDVHVVSVNWGAWDGGMVSDGLKKIFDEHGVSLVPMEEGPVAMTDQLSTLFFDQPQVILGGTLPMASADTTGELNTYEVTRKLSEEANPFLSHHVIQGNAVLPIINASNWMAQTAEDLYPGFNLHKLENAKLYKGIVFDGSEKDQYTVTVKELEKSEEEITVSVMVSSAGAKLPLNHYGSTVTLRSKPAERPVHQIPSKDIVPVVADASSVYEDGTLFHGTDFRGIKQVITLDESGTTFLCEHDGVEEERQGQFPVKAVNSFLTDIMYQGLLVWVRRFQGCASLPLRTEWVQVYEALPFGKPFYVRIDVLKADDFAMEADIVAFDAETGKEYLRSHRAGVTVSRDLKWS